MQHTDRQSFIGDIVESLKRDLLSETKAKIIANPYEPYNSDVIVDLMGEYGVQRRTAREWLICAQFQLRKELKSNNK